MESFERDLLATLLNSREYPNTGKHLLLRL
jgi:hypothetical protein